MNEAYIIDYIRTPIGSYGGALSSIRADDLGAISAGSFCSGSAAFAVVFLVTFFVLVAGSSM